ncbi:hypothetical protein VRU48_01520 [Pedobacter sp. KR3-3]|uniref:Uncharacterized protein n=1 Tax=Pedobacter albus TaxID=3113905 RepID=A0ABU7I383_9SPHI|nr:hypothetical protein [Pedobacter sp. KR3-3]MEE1943766.1 hypothetical protein [Pedobacter sp. KR3-3]
MSKRNILQTIARLFNPKNGTSMPIAVDQLPFAGISLKPIALKQSKDFIQ